MTQPKTPSDDAAEALPPLPVAPAEAPRAPQPRPVRARSTGELETHVDQLASIGELMMGAAYADGDKAGIEVVAICEQLKEFVEADLLPGEVRRRLDRFDPSTFDLEGACAKLWLPEERDRLALMRLIATVTGADQVMHPGELTYIRRVATAVGLDPDALRITHK